MNEEQFEQIYNENHRWMYAKIIKDGIDCHTAEDMVVKIFMEFWRKAQKEEVLNPVGLLLNILKKRIIDEFRKKKIDYQELDQNIAAKNDTDFFEKDVKGVEQAKKDIDTLINCPKYGKVWKKILCSIYRFHKNVIPFYKKGISLTILKIIKTSREESIYQIYYLIKKEQKKLENIILHISELDDVLSKICDGCIIRKLNPLIKN